MPSRDFGKQHRIKAIQNLSNEEIPGARFSLFTRPKWSSSMDNCQPQTSYPGNHQVILGTSLQTSSDKSEFYRRMLAKEGHFWQATELKNRVKNPIRIEDRNREQRINFGYARRKCHLQIYTFTGSNRLSIITGNVEFYGIC